MSLPVYLKVHNVLPRPLQDPHNFAGSKESAAEMILHHTWAAERTNRRIAGRILQSSLDGKEPAAHLPQRNGLIGTVMEAYANHHHLILRLFKSNNILVLTSEVFIGLTTFGSLS